MSVSASPSAASALRDGALLPVADPAESPLTWFARRRGKDGRPLIAPHQLLAGERLRADFTRAQMMPRVTADWNASGVRGSRVPGTLDPSETVLAAKQRVRNALNAVGPEFSGVLMDVCCFLKGLEQVEQEHGWPARASKVVLTLALDRLARHYGYDARAVGRATGRVSAWTAPRMDEPAGEAATGEVS